MDKNTMIKVVNRDSGTVGYSIPEDGINRMFAQGQEREISFGELEKLTFVPGGIEILSECLVVKNEEALKQLLPAVEPEYFYSEADVKNLLLNGTMNEFLDCLDYAPSGVIELIKTLAVNLEINDVDKRKAILNSTGFDVTKAIEIKNSKPEGAEATPETKPTGRRTEAETAPKRRTAPPKYKIIEEE